MKQFLKLNDWNIIEEGFHKEHNEFCESIFSLGNGYMGQRGNFEEDYSGPSLQGNYVAGVYYPDKTRVGWWKNGYPEYFAKVLNSTNWIGIKININNIPLDLNTCTIKSFKRILNMKEGYMQRNFHVILSNGNEVKVESKRFISMKRGEIGAIEYAIVPLNFNGTIQITPYLDGDIKNKDSNYEENFWDEISKEIIDYEGYIMLKTKKSNFYVCTYMNYDILKNGENISSEVSLHMRDKFISNTMSIFCEKLDKIVVYKYVANTSSRYYEKEKLVDITRLLAHKAKLHGFELLLKEQAEAWMEKWCLSDIVIQGDIASQQGIRFNIFALNQSYTGQDERLNIGPKGFTGEKYGGSTYWDTEAYCIPFYLSTCSQNVAKNLLLYRYNHLPKAIENAEKLGFSHGAALYPMVTMNGEECHNEWEITFEEIHRNGAIAYAIYNFVNYTGDKSYLFEYGLPVLIAISRFWAERVNFSHKKNKYVLLGVTGPNEYENNVNNNWYTNKIASWCLKYTIEVIEDLKEANPNNLDEIKKLTNFKEDEIHKWKNIIENMYYPYDEKLQVFLQQDGYMDKEQSLVKDLDKSILPLNAHWSWDRILRSCFIKQADVLQGLYFFEDEYELETIKRNFYFYEPRTVHESSLSPCVHSILACKIGDYKKAYEMYLRTSRLDLDDYNNDTCDGCHITSMAGSWMTVVQGFGGFRVIKDRLILNSCIPREWDFYSFTVVFRDAQLKIKVSKKSVEIINTTNSIVNLSIYHRDYTLREYENLSIIN